MSGRMSWLWAKKPYVTDSASPPRMPTWRPAHRQRAQRDEPGEERWLLAEELGADVHVEGRASLRDVTRVQHEARLVGRRQHTLAERRKDQESGERRDEQGAPEARHRDRQRTPGR
jgi:hypothetical protein